MLPIMHLSANASKINYTSGSNNSKISTVLDISGNGYHATATGNVYLDEYEGIKSFAFKSQTSLLQNTSFPALGTSSWSMAVSYANQDTALNGNFGIIMNVGGGYGDGSLAGWYVGVPRFDKSNTTIEYTLSQKWNTFIFTYNSQTSLQNGYVNSINTFCSEVQAINITTTKYALSNSTGVFYTQNYGSSKSFINEAMIFNTCLTDSQITNLFGYFKKNLSCSTVGGSKQKLRNPTFSRVVV